MLVEKWMRNGLATYAHLLSLLFWEVVYAIWVNVTGQLYTTCAHFAESTVTLAMV